MHRVKLEWRPATLWRRSHRYFIDSATPILRWNDLKIITLNSTDNVKSASYIRCSWKPVNVTSICNHCIKITLLIKLFLLVIIPLPFAIKWNIEIVTCILFRSEVLRYFLNNIFLAFRCLNIILSIIRMILIIFVWFTKWSSNWNFEEIQRIKNL